MTSCLLSVNRPECPTSRFHSILLPALHTLDVQHKVNYFFSVIFLLLCAVGTSGVCLPHHLYSGDLPEDSGLRPGDASQLLHPKRLEPAGFCHRHCWVRNWSPLLLPVQTSPTGSTLGPHYSSWSTLLLLVLTSPHNPNYSSLSPALLLAPGSTLSPHFSRSHLSTCSPVLLQFPGSSHDSQFPFGPDIYS